MHGTRFGYEERRGASAPGTGRSGEASQKEGLDLENLNAVVDPVGTHTIVPVANSVIVLDLGKERRSRIDAHRYMMDAEKARKEQRKADLRSITLYYHHANSSDVYHPQPPDHHGWENHR